MTSSRCKSSSARGPSLPRADLLRGRLPAAFAFIGYHRRHPIIRLKYIKFPVFCQVSFLHQGKRKRRGTMVAVRAAAISTESQNPRKSSCQKITTLLHCPYTEVTRGDYRKTQGFKILNPLPVYRSDMRRRATLLHMSHRFSPPIREARCRGAQIPEFIPLGDHLVHFTSKHRRYPRTNRNVRLHAMI